MCGNNKKLDFVGDFGHAWTHDVWPAARRGFKVPPPPSAEVLQACLALALGPG